MMGAPISETYLCDKNMHKIREKLAAELYAETTAYDGEVVWYYDPYYMYYKKL